MENVTRSENAPLIEAIERLAVEVENGRSPEFIELPHGDKILAWRDSDGELVRHELTRTPPPTKCTIQTITAEGFVSAINFLRGSDESAPSPLVRFHNGTLRAIVDHGTAERRDFAEMQVELAPPFSSEWVRWRALSGKPQSRAAMSEFVDDNSDDFADPADGHVSHLALRDWLDRLSLKVVREVTEADDDASESVQRSGSATTVQITRLGLRVHEGGPRIGFRCRWRAGIDESGRLMVAATVINAAEAERRVWLGPVPENADWVPLVERVGQMLGPGSPVIV